MGEYITLKDNRDFSRLYKRGKSYVSPVLVTYVMKNKSHSVRFGITTSKKIGKAVVRSRARRVIRAAYYELYPNIDKGYDFVFVARGKISLVKSQVILKYMKLHLSQAGVYSKDSGNSKDGVFVRDGVSKE